MTREGRQKNLFFLPSSKAFLFKIFPREASQSQLRDYIELAGGICLDADDDDSSYAIPLVDFNWLVKNKMNVFNKSEDDQRDYFKPDFVYECYLKDKVLDLNQYKIKKIRNPDLPKYNANRILRHEISWDDLIISKVSSLHIETPSRLQSIDKEREEGAEKGPEGSQSRSQKPRKIPQSRANSKDLRQVYGKVFEIVQSPAPSPQNSQNSVRRRNTDIENEPTSQQDAVVNNEQEKNRGEDMEIVVEEEEEEEGKEGASIINIVPDKSSCGSCSSSQSSNNEVPIPGCTMSSSDSSDS